MTGKSTYILVPTLRVGTTRRDALRRTPSEAFTLIELLVVIAIIILLISLLLPAIQKVREAGSRITCANHLRNIGVALHNHANANGELPPGGVEVYDEEDKLVRTHSWAVFLLPFIEQSALFNRYNWDVNWKDPLNRPVIRHPLKVMQCPSAEADRTGVWQSAVSDYGVLNAVQDKRPKDGLIEEVANFGGVMWVVGKSVSVFPKISDIADGTSSTILIAEDAGRPQLWRAGESIPDHSPVSGAAWADRENCFTLDGYSADGATRFGSCAINCTNSNEIYSFHPGGANILFADGSVHFFHADVRIGVVAALVTRAGGEIVSAKDYEE